MADKPYDPFARRAAFAQEFSGTTNLDQQRRFREDITAARDRDEARKKAEYEQMQRSNPELMRAETGRRREERAAREGFLKQNLAERKLQWEAEKAGRLEQLNAKRLELQMRQEKRLLDKEAFELDKMDKQEEDMLAIQIGEDELRQIHKPGSPEYKEGLMQLFFDHPNVDKDFRNFQLKRAGEDDPDAAYEAAVIRMRDFPGSRATVPLPGGGTATIVGPKAESDIDSQIAKAQDRRARAVKSADPEYMAFAEQELSRLQGMKGGQTQSTAAPTAEAAPNNFTDPESYKKAYQNAASGTILLYNGKQYRKP